MIELPIVKLSSLLNLLSQYGQLVCWEYQFQYLRELEEPIFICFFAKEYRNLTRKNVIGDWDFTRTIYKGGTLVIINVQTCKIISYYNLDSLMDSLFYSFRFDLFTSKYVNIACCTYSVFNTCYHTCYRKESFDITTIKLKKFIRWKKFK